MSMMDIKIGVVESNADPLKLGRVRVRVFGVHTDNIGVLPTEDLPWAIILGSPYDASMSGIGDTPRLLNGTWVVVSFLDGEQKQKPMILGTLKGYPSTETNLSPADVSTAKESLDNTPPSKAPSPVVVTNGSGAQEIIEPPYIGSLTNSQVASLKAAIAQRETGGQNNPYAVENTIGFIGKYQFGAAYLKDKGYIYATAQGTNKEIIDSPTNWTGKDGVVNKETFFQKIELQESLMEALLKRNYTTMANAGVVDSSSMPEKTAGLLAAAHLKGAGGAIRLVKGDDSADAYGTRASDYYNLGYASITGKKTVELPTVGNMSSPAIDKNIPPRDDATKYDVGIVRDGGQQGFKDPNGKYPLKKTRNESDLNRLARGSKISQTIVGEKESNRVTSVPVANSGATWHQSPIPYNAKYPYNRVMASEAGHIFEIDDTPNSERINLHHIAGSFMEIDSLGNRVERTAGIRTIIVDKDELVYIQGSGHVALDGDLSVRVGGSCHIEVLGNANVHVHGNLNQQVDGDFNLTANNISMSAKASAKFAAAASMEVGSEGTFTVGGSGTMVNALGNLGAPIMLLGVSAPDNKTVDSYSPTINVPAPISRQEDADFTLEGANDVTDVIYQDAPPPGEPQKIDVTPAFDVVPVIGICGFGELSPSTVLTANYKLSDLIGTHLFPYKDGQHGLTGEEIACNLKQLAINVIEPLRAKYADKGFRINSCFREAGSSISTARGVSQHELGQAVDIGFSAIRGQSNDREQYYALAQEIRDTVPFDQLLLEVRQTNTGYNVWIHISFTTGTLRKQVLTMYNDKTYGEGLYLLPQA